MAILGSLPDAFMHTLALPAFGPLSSTLQFAASFTCLVHPQLLTDGIHRPFDI